MIGIIKYRAGNLASVSNALDRLRANYTITDQSNELDECDAVIFPGVGHASSAMEDLRRRNLDHWLRNTSKPVLGICLGMQLMYEFTEEGAVETLGMFPGRLQKFDASRAKVPHMGWNQIRMQKDHPLFKGFRENDYFYFVHSYYAPNNEYTVASCEYISNFTAVAAKDNFMGVQFHPEKSERAGSLVLRNFLKITQRFIHKSL